METDPAQTEQEWRGLFTDPTHPAHQYTRRSHAIWKHVPGDPRCKICLVPLGGPAASVLRLTKKAPAKGNPNFCNTCELWLDHHPGGAEIEMSLLFADVRGSTGLAEKMSPAPFAELMREFYKVANRVLIRSDAWMQKPVGDEIVALYVPVFAPNHAARAIESASELLDALSAELGDGLGVGGGVHTGVAYIGTVGVEGSTSYDLTVLGDPPNVTSRLASVAAAGEMLVSEDAFRSSGLDPQGLESRSLTLKGREAPLSVRVISSKARVA